MDKTAIILAFCTENVLFRSKMASLSFLDKKNACNWFKPRIFGQNDLVSAQNADLDKILGRKKCFLAENGHQWQLT